jgi:predicted acyltransferase
MTAQPPPVPSTRLASIDALRGFDMLWITGGAGVVTALEKWVGGQPGWFSTQLQHVPWEGMRFEDLIMPLFMFLAGVSLPFSVAGRLARNPSKLQLWKHVMIRVLILWIFGMICQGNLLSYDPAKFKFYSNTLQAIAAGYLIATALHLYASLRWQAIATGGLMLATWGLFAWGGNDYSVQNNIAILLDKVVLGSHQDGTPYAWILASLNFGATTMLGVFAGRLLRNKKLSGNRKTLWLLAGGAAAIALSFAWMPFHPLIKHLWTGSFVLLSGGLSLLLLAVFYWIIDVRGWKAWSYFFTVIGVNAITAYMLTEIWRMQMISGPLVNGLKRWVSADPLALIQASAALAVLWLLLWHLHRQKIYLKV